MRHFIVTITFRVPFDSLGEAKSRHGAFLSEGYRDGMLLISGPQTPPAGGIVVARAESAAALRAYMDRDPFTLEGLATYSIVEFAPTMSVPALGDWVS